MERQCFICGRKFIPSYVGQAECGESDCITENYSSSGNLVEDWQIRLLEETQELALKLQGLNSFMAGSKFPTLSRVEKDLQYEQSRTMSKYLQILGKRLEYYGIEFKHKEKKNEKDS